MDPVPDRWTCSSENPALCRIQLIYVRKGHYLMGIRPKRPRPEREAAGGKKPPSAASDHFYAVGPVASEVGLLRALLAKPLYPGDRRYVEEVLSRAVRRPMASWERAKIERKAAAWGAVYEEPDAPPVPAGAVAVMPWGTLPKAPPGRRVV